MEEQPPAPADHGSCSTAGASHSVNPPPRWSMHGAIGAEPDIDAGAIADQVEFEHLQAGDLEAQQLLDLGLQGLPAGGVPDSRSSWRSAWRSSRGWSATNMTASSMASSTRAATHEPSTAKPLTIPITSATK